jgi:spore germination cell wall hydrolase CwlJ-like protein
MLEKTIAAWRRADRSMGVALALTLVFVAGAGAIVPPTDQIHAKSAAAHASAAPLPLKLVPEQPVEAIVNPASLVLRTAPVDVSPLLRQLVVEKLLAEERCLAEAMYYEARGEGVDGEKAIAEVVFHRMRSRGFPRSVCGVVYQGAVLGHGCQFSFACSGELEQPKAMAAWAKAKRLAASILTGLVQLGDETEDAISFHAVDVQPGWSDSLVRTIQIGNHVFYRAASRTRSS